MQHNNAIKLTGVWALLVGVLLLSGCSGANDYPTSGQSDYPNISSVATRSAMTDSDGDAVSNIVESIAGPNPHTVETEQLEIRNTTHTGVSVIEYDSRYYESLFPAQRPYYEQTENNDYSDDRVYRSSKLLSIELDQHGTGSYSDVNKRGNDADLQTNSVTTTRTNSKSSVALVVADLQASSGAGSSTNATISIQTTALGDQLFKHDGVRKYQSTSNDKVISSYELTGTPVDESDMCEPMSGSIVYELSMQQPGTDTVTSTNYTTSKHSDDLYWLHSVTGSGGQLLEQYHLRTLGVKFYCGYRELR